MLKWKRNNAIHIYGVKNIFDVIYIYHVMTLPNYRAVNLRLRMNQGSKIWNEPLHVCIKFDAHVMSGTLSYQHLVQYNIYVCAAIDRLVSGKLPVFVRCTEFPSLPPSTLFPVQMIESEARAGRVTSLVVWIRIAC